MLGTARTYCHDNNHKPNLGGQRSNFWQRYGLEQSPFGETSHYAMYYPLPRWQEHFSALEQFYRCSLPLMVVVGVLGSGKSMLLSQSLNRIHHEELPSLTIKANANLSPSKISEQAVEHFQVSVSPDAPAQQKLFDVVDALKQRKQKAILLIDDAHTLSSESLQKLLDVAVSQNPEHVYLYMVLFGEPMLETHLTRLILNSAYQFEVAKIELSPLNLQETQQYLKHRLTKAGLSGKFPFSDIEVGHIHRFSGGVPGRINRVAQQTLLNAVRQQEHIFPKQETVTKYPVNLSEHKVKLLSVVLLSVTLTVFWFLQNHNVNSIGQTRFVEVLPVASEPITKISQTATPPQLLTPSAQQQLEQIKLAASDLLLSTPQKVQTVPKPQVIAQPITPVANAVLNNTESKVLTVSPVSSKPMIQTQQATKSQQPVSVENKKIAASPIVKQQAKIIDPAVTQGQYALQLLARPDKQSVIDFMTENNLQDKATIAERIVNNQTWYVLVYGHYRTFDSAHDAIKKLPDSIQAEHPWVRRLSPAPNDVK